MNGDMDARPSDEHPLDVDLVAFADGELAPDAGALIESHLGTCARCREVVAALDAPMGDFDLEVLSDLSPALTSVFSAEPEREPEPGDLWHVEWDDAAMFVAVLDLDDDGVVAVPLSFEAVDDDPAVVIAAEESPLDTSLYAWVTLERVLPLGVFSRLAGVLPPGALVPERRAAAASRKSWSGAITLADLAFAADRLADAAWTPQLAAPLPSLAELVEARGLRPSGVSAATGIPAGQLTSLLRGQREPTDTEADRLAHVLQADVSVIKRPLAIPRELVRAIERPIHRAKIRARAAASAVSEAVARRQLASAVMAMPARTSHAERDVEAWDELVRHQLDG